MSSSPRIAGPGFHVVHAGPDYLVVHKGPDVLSVPNRPGDDALPQRVAARLRKLGLADGNTDVAAVHRLDRNVSGLVLVSLTPAAHAKLVAQFREGLPSRHYLAVVEGRVKDPEGSIRKELATRGQLARTVGRGQGVPAVTHYKVRRYGPGCTLLELELETGRKHQIRAHLAGIGHPVLGDRDFGASEKYGFDRRRIALHAFRLNFPEPASGKTIDIVDDAPATFERPFAEFDRARPQPGPRRPKAKPRGGAGKRRPR